VTRATSWSSMWYVPSAEGCVASSICLMVTGRSVFFRNS